VTRQIYAENVSFIVEDPAGSNYYRITEPAAFFLGLLDGRRTVGEAWDSCVAQRGDEAPTQRECLDLLGKLQLYGLLLGELPLAPDMVLERKRQTRQKRWAQRTGQGLFPNVPVLNPEPMLERHRNLVRLIFSKWGLALWLGVAGIALWRVVVRWDSLASQSNVVGLLDADNLLLLSIGFIVMRTLHELGHAAACKAFGGRVTEIGLMMIAFVLPVPYCDASSAWRFQRTRDRVIVGAGGVLVEMFFAAIAAITWSVTDEPWLRALCFNIMVLSSVTTLVFNLNPLLRYDGYYILADLLGIANLAQKSRELWQYLAQRVLFGVRAVRPPEIRSRAEAWVLGTYGALALPYRVFVMVSILLIVASKYLGLGMALAAVLIAVWVVWPLLKGIGFLLSSPQLMGHRPRAFAVTLVMIALVGVALGVVPAPAGTVALGTIEPSVHKPLRVGESGFLAEVRAAPGEVLKHDEPVFVLSSPELRTDLATAEARLDKAEAEYEKADLRGTRAEARLAVREVDRARAERDRLAQRRHDLTLESPADGTFVVANADIIDPANLNGRFFKRGTLIGYVSSLDDVVVRVAVSDKEAAYLFSQSDIAEGLKKGLIENVDLAVRIRVPGRFGETVTGHFVRGVGAGTRELMDPALATATGGDIAPDPEDTSGRRTLLSQFILEIKPDRAPEGWLPGLRARVRFDLPPEPLLKQWWRVAQQYVKGRIG
jgi:putative peptide zinc metalloprotease protein